MYRYAYFYDFNNGYLLTFKHLCYISFIENSYTKINIKLVNKMYCKLIFK